MAKRGEVPAVQTAPVQTTVQNGPAFPDIQMTPSAPPAWQPPATRIQEQQTAQIPGFNPAPVSVAPAAPQYTAPMPAPIAAPTFGSVDELETAQSAPLLDISDLLYMDLSNVADDSFRLLEPNKEYEGEIIKVEKKRSSNGNVMLLLRLKISTGEYEGTIVFDTVTLTEKAAAKFKSLARHCDLLGDDGRFTGQSEQDFLENIVRFGITHHEYNGVIRNKVSFTYSKPFETPGL